MTDKTTGLTHLINSTRYSLQGLKSAVKNEAAFRHELFMGIFAIPLAFYLGDDRFEIAFMIGAYLLVLVAELLNSAVECVVDRIGTERHELSGRAKDQGSAAVFIALVNMAIVWALMIFA
ncbi:diacylglycerol kinase [Pasteurellaceae bacterium 22721_9_1]